ncbi:MAG: polymer-forming cytoskeletal protein [Bryobacteraceae bacterium]
MWNKRKEDDYAPKPVNLPPATPEPTKKETVPVSTTPVRLNDSDLSRNSATIGKSVTVKGQIISREDLYVDGEIEGTIDVHEHRLTIGPNGKAQAGIKAREIVILGAVQGNVEAADRIDIRKDAKLVGDIKTARIVIEDGAYFKGSIDIVKTVESKTPVATKPQISPAVPAITANAAEYKR